MGLQQPQDLIEHPEGRMGGKTRGQERDEEECVRGGDVRRDNDDVRGGDGLISKLDISLSLYRKSLALVFDPRH